MELSASLSEVEVGSGYTKGCAGSLGKIHAAVRELHMNTAMARANHFNRLGPLGETVAP